MKLPLQFLLDENVELRLLHQLQHLGYDVKKIGVDHPHQIPDEEVLAIAVQEKRVLLTNDRSDFGELIFRHHKPHCGVILFRVRSGEIATKMAQLHLVLTKYTEHLTSFIVIEKDKIRIRKNLDDIAA